MKKGLLNKALVVALVIGCSSCTNIPSTEELDKEISSIQSEIQESESEANRYSAGLIRLLTDVRTGILGNTKAILSQKRTGLKRFIPVSYTVDGKNYASPENKQKTLAEIESDLDILSKEMTKTQNEINKYKGGLIMLMLEAQLATNKVTKALLEQKLLLLKHDIPLYTVMPSPDTIKKEPEFKPTPGKDIDKF